MAAFDDLLAELAANGNYSDYGTDNEVFAAYADLEGYEDMGDIDSWADEAEHAYIGWYDNDEQMVQEYASDVLDIPESLTAYMDWAKMARDSMMDVAESNGYYFHQF